MGRPPGPQVRRLLRAGGTCGRGKLRDRLRWELGWGRKIHEDPKLEAFARSKRRGHWKPWDDRPLLAEHLAWVWEAFWELTTCRPPMGGAIPWGAIHEYAGAHGIRDEERFVRLIRAMDREAMNRHRDDG